MSSSELFRKAQHITYCIECFSNQYTIETCVKKNNGTIYNVTGERRIFVALERAAKKKKKTLTLIHILFRIHNRVPCNVLKMFYFYFLSFFYRLLN